MPFRHAAVIGASGGIGGALVEALAERGAARIHALSRSGVPSARIDTIRPGRIDITDEASISDAARRIGKDGPLDLVMVATGLLHGEGVQPEKTWRALDSEVMARLFAVNATGPALVAKHFLPLLRRDGRAVFAALSARVGSIGDNRLGGWYGYRASKAALNMLVRTLSIELARTHPQAICVALHPGTMATGLSQPFAGNAPSVFSPEQAAGYLLRVLEGLAPAGSGSCFAWDGQAIIP